MVMPKRTRPHLADFLGGTELLAKLGRPNQDAPYRDKIR